MDPIEERDIERLLKMMEDERVIKKILSSITEYQLFVEKDLITNKHVFSIKKRR